MTLPLKACKKEPLEDDLETVRTFHKDDFDWELLSMQLQTFGVYIQQTQEQQSSSLAITGVKKMFLSSAWGSEITLITSQKTPAVNFGYARHKFYIWAIL